VESMEGAIERMPRINHNYSKPLDVSQVVKLELEAELARGKAVVANAHARLQAAHNRTQQLVVQQAEAEVQVAQSKILVVNAQKEAADAQFAAAQADLTAESGKDSALAEHLQLQARQQWATATTKKEALHGLQSVVQTQQKAVQEIAQRIQKSHLNATAVEEKLKAIEKTADQNAKAEHVNLYAKETKASAEQLREYKAIADEEQAVTAEVVRVRQHYEDAAQEGVVNATAALNASDTQINSEAFTQQLAMNVTKARHKAAVEAVNASAAKAEATVDTENAQYVEQASESVAADAAKAELFASAAFEADADDFAEVERLLNESKDMWTDAKRHAEQAEHALAIAPEERLNASLQLYAEHITEQAAAAEAATSEVKAAEEKIEAYHTQAQSLATKLVQTAKDTKAISVNETAEFEELADDSVRKVADLHSNASQEHTEAHAAVHELEMLDPDQFENTSYWADAAAEAEMRAAEQAELAKTTLQKLTDATASVVATAEAEAAAEAAAAAAAAAAKAAEEARAAALLASGNRTIGTNFTNATDIADEGSVEDGIATLEIGEDLTALTARGFDFA